MSNITIAGGLTVVLVYMLAAGGTPAEIRTYYHDGNYIMEVIPNGNEISGLQTNFIFDARTLQIVNISEGEFMSQNGTFYTYSHIGTGDTTGHIKSSFSVILGPNNTTVPGTYLILNTSGYGCIIPTNVLLSSPDALPVPYVLNVSCELNVGTITGHIHE